MTIGRPKRGASSSDPPYNSPVALRLSVFGKPQLSFQGQYVEFSLTKPGTMLLYLACKGDWVTRAELAFLFQPDASEERAQANLRQLIHRARQYPWSEGLEVSETHLRWVVESDFWDFRQAVERQDWQGAVALYRADLLSGLPTKDLAAVQAWVDLERSDLSRKWNLAGRQLLRQLEANSRWSEAVSLVELLRQNDGFDEELLQNQLRLLALDGRPQEGLACYQAFAALLEDELGIKPLESTQALAESLNSAKPQPALFAAAALPVATTVFVGRTQELSELSQMLLQPSCRLLSIVGLGGLGKTRLALELAHLQQPNFADGVFFVPLASVSSADGIVSAIANQLGILFSNSGQPQLQLHNYLCDKSVLLVLDNFEQLCDQAGVLEDLLQAPKLKLVVTSRQVLALKGEWIFDLDGLQLPNSDQPHGDSEAVRLFLDRAQQLSHQFIRDSETLTAVAEICRMVEGMPLAIELTAGWIRGLTAQEISTQLSTSLDLLSSRQKNTPNRQQSIQFIFDSSLQQLNQAERTVLHQLAVFEGGFDFAAYKFLVGAPLELLISLINRCLVRRSASGRYTLHELLRQYLKQRGPRVPDTGYVHYYLNLLAGQEPALRGAKPKIALSALLPDLDNLRQAWTLALSARDWVGLIGTEPAMRLLFFTLGLLEEAQEFYLQVLSLPSDETLQPAVHGRLQFKLGAAQIALQRFQPLAESDIDELINQFRLHQLPTQLAEALRLKADLSMRQNQALEFAAAAESLAIGQQHNDLQICCSAYQTLKAMAWHRGDYQEAFRMASQWLESSRQLADTHQYVAALLDLADLLHYWPHPEYERQSLLEEAFTLEAELCSIDLRITVLDHRAVQLFEGGNYGQSEGLFLEVLGLCLQSGNLHRAGVGYYNLARSLREQGRFAEVYAALERSYGLLPGMLSLADLAETARLEGDFPKAHRNFQRALSSSLEHDYPIFQVLRCLLYLANFYADLGHLAQAYALVRWVDAHPSCGDRNTTIARNLITRLDVGPLATAVPSADLRTVVELELRKLNQIALEAELIRQSG